LACAKPGFAPRPPPAARGRPPKSGCLPVPWPPRRSSTPGATSEPPRPATAPCRTTRSSSGAAGRSWRSGPRLAHAGV